MRFARNTHKEDPVASLPVRNGIRGDFKQRLINKMLNEVKSPYKILILDDHGTRVLNGCMRMHNLMDYGVTLVEQLGIKRQPVKSSEAIYFVAPTNEVVDAIVRDVNAGMYKAFHVFFTSEASDAVFQRMIGARIADKLASLVDMRLDFTASEPLVFNCEMHFDLPKLFGTAATRDASREVAKRLYDVLLSCGEAPVIRHQNNPVARDVATELERLYNEGEQLDASAKLGTIVILDRSIDVVAPLLHELTYEAMLADLNPLKNGLLTIPGGRNGGPARTIPIDCEDPLWCELRHKHIAEVTKACNDKLAALKQEFPQLASWDPKAGDVSMRQLGDAVRNLPQFQQRQMKISVHTELTGILMRRYDDERLEGLIKAEQRFATGTDEADHKIGSKEFQKDALAILKDTYPQTTKSRFLLTLGASQGSDEAGKAASGSGAMRPGGIDSLRLFDPQAKYKADRTKGNKGAAFESSRYVPFVKQVMEGAIDGTLSSNDFPWLSAPPSGHGAKAAAVSNAGAGTGFGASRAAAEPDEKKGRFGGLFGKSKAASTAAPGHAAPAGAGGAARVARGKTVAKLDLGSAEQVELHTADRLWVFVVGGLAPNEARCAYEVTRAMGQEVVVGGSSMITGDKFAGDLELLA